MFPRPWFLRLMLCLAVLAGSRSALAVTPLLQIDMVAGDDAIFVYNDISPWYALGEVVTLVRGSEIVGRVKVESVGRTISRLSLFERQPGKKPRPGDRLVGQDLPPKGLPLFTGTRTGFEIGVAVENTVIVYENLSAYYPVGSAFRVVEGSVTIGQARITGFSGHTTTFAADVATGLEVRPGMRVFPLEEPAPLHALLAPERNFIGKGMTFEDELGMGPVGEKVGMMPQPTKALPGLDNGKAMEAKDGEGKSMEAKDGGEAMKAGESCPAKVDSIAGAAEVKLDGGDWKKAELGNCLFGADQIKTGNESGLALALSDGGMLKFSQNSMATIQGERRKEESKREITGAEMTEGEIWADIASDAGAFGVTTPTGVVNVRGTEFSVRADKDDKGEARVQVFTLEGEVEVADKEGKKISLPKGKAGRILGKVLSDAFDFDIASFQDYLNSWKNLLTPGGIRDFIKGKIFDEIQGKLNEAIDKVIPGGSNLIPGGGAPKLGF